MGRTAAIILVQIAISLAVPAFAGDKCQLLFASTEFQVGSLNSSDSIRDLKEINGLSIENLEARLRPGKDSVSGFIGPAESLRELLVSDNDLVTIKLGLTHQKIAAPLREALSAFERTGGESEAFITLHGTQYRIFGKMYRGFQVSPFQDGTRSAADVQVQNLRTREQISFAGLMPEMIERYGFYEGKNIPYRLDPRGVVRVFDYLSEPSAKTAVPETVSAPASSSAAVSGAVQKFNQAGQVENILAENFARGRKVRFIHGSSSVPVEGQIVSFKEQKITLSIHNEIREFPYDEILPESIERAR